VLSCPLVGHVGLPPLILFRNALGFTAEREEQLKQLAKTPDIYERLSKALGKDCSYCVCARVCVCACECVCARVCVCACACVYRIVEKVCQRDCGQNQQCVYMYVRMCVCMHACVYVSSGCVQSVCE